MTADRFPPRSAGGGSWPAREGRWFLEVLTVTAFVVAQPVLDVFGKSPETFVFRDAGRMDLVLFALTVTVVPAVALWAVAAAAGTLGTRAREIAQIVLMWALLSFLGIQVLKRATPLLGVGLAAAGAAIGALLVWGVFLRSGVRRWVRVAWPASVAFILVFLLISPTSTLFLPARAGAAATPRGSASTSVVMVVFDQLPLLTLLDREGEIDPRRFPNFARLAEDATWHRNFTNTESITRFALPTLLSGKLIGDRRSHPSLADHPDNLFSLLQDTHEMNVYELFSTLCPVDPCSRAPATPARRASSALPLEDAVGIWLDVSWIEPVTRDIGAQFEEELVEDRETRHERDLSPEERSRHVRRHRQPFHLTQLLRSMRRVEDPTLHFLHVLVPHYPWRFFPSGIEYARPEDESYAHVPGARPATWINARWPVELTRLRHVLQVQFADRLLGDVLDRLEELGTYDRSLVVVTSDHGRGLHPGRVSGGIREPNAHEVLWVPLLVKPPGQREGALDERNFMGTDLLPTIADHLGLSIPWEVDGSSMLPPDAGRGPEKRVRGVTISVETAWERMRREVFVHPMRTSRHPYGFGPRAGLLGRRVGELRAGPPVDVAVELDLPGALDRAVDTGSGPVPGFVSGVLRGDVARGDTVAAAVNGRIAGTSNVFRDARSSLRFEVLAPQSLFRNGRNRLELFLVEGEALRPLS